MRSTAVKRCSRGIRMVLDYWEDLETKVPKLQRRQKRGPPRDVGMRYWPVPQSRSLVKFILRQWRLRDGVLRAASVSSLYICCGTDNGDCHPERWWTKGRQRLAAIRPWPRTEASFGGPASRCSPVGQRPETTIGLPAASWQAEHISRRHGVSATDFDTAWHDPNRHDLSKRRHLEHGPYFLSVGWARLGKPLKMVWRWQGSAV